MKRFTLNNADVKKWLMNTAVFAAPFLLVFLGSIQSGVPLKESLLVVYLYGLNVSVDLLKKFVAAHEIK